MTNRKYVPESIQAYIVPSGDAHQVREKPGGTSTKLLIASFSMDKLIT